MKGKEVAFVFQVYKYVCIYVCGCLCVCGQEGAVKRVSRAFMNFYL